MDDQGRLLSFPRPASDNGRGLHFTVDLREDPNHPSISTCISHLLQVGAKWTVLYGDDLSTSLAADMCWRAGIMPVVRPKCKIDGAAVAWEHYIELLHKTSIPAYIQIFNEPGDSREWNNRPATGYEKIFADKWVEAAGRVIAAGGYPGLQILGKNEFDAVVVSAGRNNPIWQKTVFILHNYGVNHPPAYPYDPRNQQDHPGSTIMDDDTAVLNFLEYAKWMSDSLGLICPIIGGEGGWQYGGTQDNRYPQVVSPLHGQYHKEMYQWFATGTLSNGMPLPDYLFSITSWISEGWGTDDWFLGNGHPDTVAQVASIPPFVRKFSWDYPVKKPLPQVVLDTAKSVAWMPINTTAALYQYAQAQHLGNPQTDEIEFTFGTVQYVLQVFDGGIVYAPKGQWDKVAWIAKQ